MWKRYVYMFCAMAVMVVIFGFSSQPYSETMKTSDAIKKPIEAVIKAKVNIDENDKDLKEKISKILTKVIRKCAHMFLFGTLSLFLVLYIRTYGVSEVKAVLITLTVCFFYACSDEWHQGFVKARDSQFIDVIVDCCGSIVALVIFYVIRKCIDFINKRRKKYGKV